MLLKNSYFNFMLTSLLNFIDFVKNISLDQIKEFFKNFGLYLYELLKEIWGDVKENKGQNLMFLAWLLISLLCGFTFSMIAMVVHSCYVHHMQDGTCDVCEHEDMLKYTLVICIGSLLHVIF